MEEDRLFLEWGWGKDLIQRRWVSPHGSVLPFDYVVEISSEGPKCEEYLKALFVAYGTFQHEQTRE